VLYLYRLSEHDDGWTVEVAETRQTAQVGSIHEIEPTVRNLIGAWFEIPPDSFDIEHDANDGV
jgi:hypothetical protein